MPTLIAKNAMRYASKELVAGERFEASDSDAHVLVSIGKAERADDHVNIPPSESHAAPRRRYSRRDMRAES